MMWEKANRYIEDAAFYATEIRRELHRYPELSGQEFQTVRIIERELQKMNIAFEYLLPTGICAVIKGTGEEKKTFALRADIDALPIKEETWLTFCAENIGCMHACGHDVHTAILLGIAKVLNEIKQIINIDVKFIFQPAEEGDGGAQRLVEKGVLKGVDEILGLHVMPELPAGAIGLKYGKVHAASLLFDLKITGRKSHGAQPEKGADAIAGTAQVISSAQLLLSRELSPLESGLITFGTIRGGDARNVIADEVLLEGVIRGEESEICSKLKKRLETLTGSLCQGLGLSSAFLFKEGYPALINDDSVVNRVRGALKQQGGIKIREIEAHTMTVDDFSYYLQEIPGALLFLGSGFSDKENSGLHTSEFEVNEICIKTGIEALLASVLL